VETILGYNFRGKTVNLDDTLFVDCSFEDCLLVLAGGVCAWRNCRFNNCSVTLEGNASNTVQILKAFGYTIDGDLFPTQVM
jgi:hypothetical protein